VITGWDMDDAEKRYYLKKREEVSIHEEKEGCFQEAGEAQYYDKHGVLKEIIDEPVEMSLKTELRRSIILVKGGEKLKNISIKVDRYKSRESRKCSYEVHPISDTHPSLLSQNLKEEMHIE